LWPGRRLPGPLPMAPPPVARRRCRSEPVLSANRPPFPKLDPAPVARTSVLAPFTLTRLPVSSLDGASEPKGPRVQLGCPRGLGRCLAARGPRQAGGSVPRSVAPLLAAPVARCSSLWSCSSARRSGCPVLVASERGFSPRPESPPPREPEPFSPSLSPEALFGGPGHLVPGGVRRCHRPPLSIVPYRIPTLGPPFRTNRCRSVRWGQATLGHGRG
jgi:hypothetical protein